MNVIAEAERLLLREFEPRDRDALATVFGDPRVMYFGPGVRSPEETVAWIERMRGLYAAHGFGLWAAVERASGTLLGPCGLIPQQVDGTDEVEVGYRLARHAWGRGLATEAARASRDHATTRLGLRRLISIIEPANGPSIRVAEKNGMHLERTTEMWGRPVRIYAINL